MKPALLQSMICLSLWALATLPKSWSVEAVEKDSFRQAYFMEHRHSYLAVEKIAELMAHDFEGCALSCLRYHNCFSINMATQPSDASGLFYCELLSTDKYNASDNFTANPNFHHYSIETPCSRDPCKNGGICIPKYDTGGSECLCKDGFAGEYCEKETRRFSVRDCSSLKRSGAFTSGSYTVNPDGKEPMVVYCDTVTDGGGWTVIQRRIDGSVDFFLDWNSYKRGFGTPSGEFWLGNDNIHRLTASGKTVLRVELEDWSGNTAYAVYGTFMVDDESNKYKLTVGSYSGTAGDSLTYHTGMYFSTKDRDNDQSGGNCAQLKEGAWWYNDCHYSNLNGQYLGNKHDWKGIMWYHWKGSLSMKRTKMMIRSP